VIEARDGAPAPGERREERPEQLGPWSPTPAASRSRCPFLASIDLDDLVGQPRPTPDTANRCLSTGEPVAASARDQRELCLTADHTACARFAPTAHSSGEPDVGPARGRRLSGPILAAVAILVLAAALAGISLAATGDLSVGLGGASPSPPTASAPAVAMTASASAPAAAATPIPAVTPAPTALPTATSVPTAAVAAVTSAPPTPTPTPKPKKYRGLTPCPGVADCYVYVVKSGDALGAIADRYGLGLDEVLARNPSIRDPALIVRGQKIRLPTPKN
jgi:LysM repeat protein